MSATANVQPSPDDVLRDLRSAAYFVDGRLALLKHYRWVYESFRETILFNKDQDALRFGHFFISAFADWHISAAIASLRALVEKNNRSLSVYGVLQRVKRAVQVGCISVPNVGTIEKAQEALVLEGKQLYAYASQFVVHYDPMPQVSTPDNFEIDRILKHVDGVLGQYWAVIFDGNRPRRVVDADPFWANTLFSFAWLPPTTFNERLSLGSEARIVPETALKDYAVDAVYPYRPTDAELAEYGVTRSDLEAARREAAAGLSDEKS